MNRTKMVCLIVVCLALGIWLESRVAVEHSWGFWPTVLRLFAYSSSAASCYLFFTKVRVQSKSAGFGYATLTSVLFVLAVSVNGGFWGGFYTDFDIARTMFVYLGIVLPLALILDRERSVMAALTGVLSFSAILCAYFFALHVFEHPVPWRSLLWAIAGLILAHALVYFCFRYDVWTYAFWSRLWVRTASIGFVAISSVFIAALVLVSFHVETHYEPKDRAKGLFETVAPHLSRPRIERKVSSSRIDGELKVVTFNAWGVEGWIPQFLVSPSRDIEQRSALMAENLALTGADVIIFQEVWKDTRKRSLISALKPFGYTYSVYGSDSIMAWFGINNGLLIVSRLPLDPDPQMTTFSRATRFDEGLIFARKGVLKTRVKLSEDPNDHRWLAIYNSHLGGFSTIIVDNHAVDFVPEEQEAKLSQAIELSEFIKRTRGQDDVLVGTDLNTHPYEFRTGAYDAKKFAGAYSLLTCRGLDSRSDCLNLHDAVFDLSPNDDAHLYTYDTKKNYYAYSGHFSAEPPGRIDFLLTDGKSLTAKSVDRVLTDFELSDHYGTNGNLRN